MQSFVRSLNAAFPNSLSNTSRLINDAQDSRYCLWFPRLFEPPVTQIVTEREFSSSFVPFPICGGGSGDVDVLTKAG
jgi:hypothetical protein